LDGPSTADLLTMTRMKRVEEGIDEKTCFWFSIPDPDWTLSLDPLELLCSVITWSLEDFKAPFVGPGLSNTHHSLYPLMMSPSF